IYVYFISHDWRSVSPTTHPLDNEWGLFIMHVPPYYRKRSRQVFIVGVVVGTIIAYLIFVLMYGKLYGDLLIERTELETELKDLQRQNETLLLDKEQLQREQRLTVQTIDIHFVNGKQLRFDRLTIHQLSSLRSEERRVGKEWRHGMRPGR